MAMPYSVVVIWFNPQLECVYLDSTPINFNVCSSLYWIFWLYFITSFCHTKRDTNSYAIKPKHQSKKTVTNTMFMRHLGNVNYSKPFLPGMFFAITGSALWLRYKRGVSFLAAKTEIGQAQGEMDRQSVLRYLPEKRRQRLFNPPHTSSFSGAWE